QVSGVTGAGPIWRGIMDGAAQWYPPQSFQRPPEIDTQTICKDDGSIPSAYCQEHSEVTQDVFGPKNRPPAADQGLYRQLKIDTWSGLIANDNCKDFQEDKFFIVLPNPSNYMGINLREFEKNWLLNNDNGKEWATRRAIP